MVKKSNWTFWKLVQAFGLAALMLLPIYSSELNIDFSPLWIAYFSGQLFIYFFMVKVLIMPDASDDRGST